MKNKLRIIFAGTPDFASGHLQSLIDGPHQVIAVYSQPDRASGRGRKQMPSPVKALALKHNLAVFQPTSLKEEKAQEQLAELNADIMVVVAYGLILPEKILSAPRFGCINVHGSLLPRWRGAAPIQRAIESGDKTTGVTIMQMDKGLDTGAMLCKKELVIGPTQSSANLYEKLLPLGQKALAETLDLFAQGLVEGQKQDNSLACYAEKIHKEEAALNWQLEALTLSRQIRAFNPWPVSFFTLNETRIRVWQAQVGQGQGPCGEIIAINSEAIEIACQKGSLLIEKLQLPGGKVVSAKDLQNSGKKLFYPGLKLL